MPCAHCLYPPFSNSNNNTDDLCKRWCAEPGFQQKYGSVSSEYEKMHGAPMLSNITLRTLGSQLLQCRKRVHFVYLLYPPWADGSSNGLALGVVSTFCAVLGCTFTRLIVLVTARQWLAHVSSSLSFGLKADFCAVPAYKFLRRIAFVTAPLWLALVPDSWSL